VDWQAFFFAASNQWPERLQERAKRRFVDPTLAEEAYTYAFEQLSAQDWHILNGYHHQASPDTFLIAVYNNLLEDFARTRFGRHRPPVWLERLGTLWTRIYYLLCIERLDKPTVVERLSTPEGPDEIQIREVIRAIYARIPNCGATLGPKPQRLADDPTDIDTPAPPSAIPENSLAEEELAALFQILAQFLAAHPSEPSATQHRNTQELARGVRQRWHSLQAALTLSSEECLILRLVYQENKKFAAVARALGIAEHQVRRQHARALKRLRTALHEAGLTAEMLRGLLDN
jgi:RNA polymerase sigma factor (sigma-70 family)